MNYFCNHCSTENGYYLLISDHGIEVEIETTGHVKKKGISEGHHRLEVKRYGFHGRTQGFPISTFGHQMA